MDKERENNGNGNTVLLTVIGVATLLVALVGATFAYFSATITNNSQQSVQVQTAAPVGLDYKSNGAISLQNIIPGQSGTSTFTVTNPATSTVEQQYDLDLIISANGLTTAKDTDAAATAAYAAKGLTGDALDKQLLVSISGESTTAGTKADKTTESSNTPNVIKCTTAAACDYTDGVTYTKAGETETSTDSTYAAGYTEHIVKNQKIGIGEVHTYTINVNFDDLEVPQNQNQGRTFAAHIDITNPVSVK